MLPISGKSNEGQNPTIDDLPKNDENKYDKNNYVEPY